MKGRDIIQRAAMAVGFISTVICYFYTVAHSMWNVFLELAAILGPLVGLFSVAYAFKNLERRCRDYARLLHQHGIDPHAVTAHPYDVRSPR